LQIYKASYLSYAYFQSNSVKADAHEQGPELIVDFEPPTAANKLRALSLTVLLDYQPSIS